MTDFICPYLGLIDDPDTSTYFPNNCNACQRADPPKMVAIQHQREFCLEHKHTDCEGFTSGWQQGFPRKLQNKHCQKHTGLLRSAQGKPSLVKIIAIILLLIAVIAGVFFTLANLQPPPPQAEVALEDIAATETQLAAAALHTPTATPTMTVTHTPTLVPTSTPTPTLTPTHTPGPALLTPFGGPGLELLIYEVVEGDILSLIADRYDTTVTVINALNVRMAPTLWAEDLLVICVGCTQPPDLPPLTPLYLEEGISIEALSAEYDVPAEDLRLWNGLGTADWIAGERWVVVPMELETER